jgi:hypothetical protein
VLRRHDHAPIPLVHRQRNELRILRNRLGRDAHVGFPRQHLLADLRRISLMQHELDLGVLPLERRDGLRQGVARLRVRRRDGQRAELVVREFLARAP